MDHSNMPLDLPDQLAAMEQLHQLTARLLAIRSMPEAMQEILDASITMHNADFGNVQVLDPSTGTLRIVAQRGFQKPFLDFFREVTTEHTSACGKALRDGKRFVIEDVPASREVDDAFKAIAAQAGFRAVQSTPLTSRGGTVVGILSTHFRSPRRFVEEKFRTLDLYARQAADIVDRIRYEEALLEGDRQKDRFLAMMSHELRNPLASIVNGVHILLDAPPGSAAKERALPIIKRQLDHLVHLVDDLMDISRVVTGKLVLRRQPVAVAELVDMSLEAMRSTIEAQRHALVVGVPSEPVTVHCDPIRMCQVLGNLIGNAAKFTPPGGHIEIRAERRGAEVSIAVRDDGIGIRAELLPQIFGMFAQIEHPGRNDGLGIGLALSRRLVELHGGRIDARSPGPGLGSEFVVILPAAER